MNRFVKVLGLIAVMLFVVTSCKSNTDKSDTEVVEADSNANVEQAPFFKLSVAQWSMHKMIWEGKASPFDFAKKAKEWGFEGIEYVSGLYNEELKKYESSEEGMKAIVERLKEESVAAGVQNLLIMVDGEGNLADPDEAVRTEAIENHKKWVDAVSVTF